MCHDVDRCPEGDLVPGYRIRPATKDDQPVIREMVRAARLNPLGVDWRRFLVVADESGRVIGCGQIKSHRDGSRELASLVVRREWRRRGVARAIVARLEPQNDRPIWLTCASHLVPFYSHLGFREVVVPGTMPPYFRRVYRISRLLLRLFQRPIYLAVMVRRSP